MTWEKFAIIWAVLVVGGIGWDMGKALSRWIRRQFRRLRNRRPAMISVEQLRRAVTAAGAALSAQHNTEDSGYGVVGELWFEEDNPDRPLITIDATVDLLAPIKAALEAALDRP